MLYDSVLLMVLIHVNTDIAGLKILFAAMRVRVQVPPGAH